MKSNPLLQHSQLPQFDIIQAQHFKPAITKLLTKNRQLIKKWLTQKKITWNNFIEPFTAINEQLMSTWAIIYHLNAVTGTKKIHNAYSACLPLITKYITEISQSKAIYQAFSSLAKSNEYKRFDYVQKEIIKKRLRDFHLAGVDLSIAKKRLFAKLVQQLAKLENKFDINVLQATQTWSICLTQKQINGLPEHALSLGQANANQKNKKGWCYSLDYPSYHALITYADSANIRKKIHGAYITRASDIGPTAKKWDNTKTIAAILKIRHKIATLVGYKNYAEYSLATKMAKTPAQVLEFLNNLITHSLPYGKKESQELKQFAKKHYKTELKPWDIAYYEEKLSKEKFNISQEDLRPYFPLAQVLTGMFTIVHRLYGITIKEKKGISTWHPDVRFFEIYDNDKTLRGQFYIDLYCRENKRGGAWMSEYTAGYQLKNGAIQTPVAFLICNFAPPIADNPALLTHQDVITLFHEFGHCLHHLLSKVKYAAASGIRDIPQDAVELPSQFMENWCWQPEALKLITKHYKTSATISKKILQQLLISHNYHAATKMLRQLRFALIDFRTYLEYNSKITNQLNQIITQVNKKISLLPVAKESRLAHSFSHMFSWGYAAGYYSYKWSEVLSADAFAKFEEYGIFNQKIGKEFLHNILETGGSEDPMVLFKKFRGREPEIDALLRHNGINSSP